MSKWINRAICGSLFLFLSSTTNAQEDKKTVGYVVKNLTNSPRIMTISNFLSAQECEHLIQIANSKLVRSTVVDVSGESNGILDQRRTSKGMFFDRDLEDPIVKAIEARIASLTEIPLENGEQIQVLHYGIGGEYRPHFDYFSDNTPGGKACLDRGGQRLLTFIMYLNTPEAGGETIFPSAKVSVTPEKGSAVFFYNCLPTGAEDPLTFHGGAPVKAGEKWIATKWFRKGRFD